MKESLSTGSIVTSQLNVNVNVAMYCNELFS